MLTGCTSLTREQQSENDQTLDKTHLDEGDGERQILLCPNAGMTALCPTAFN